MSLTVEQDVIEEIENIDSQEKLSLEALTLLISKGKVNEMETKLREEFRELNERQGKVKYLHNVIKAINAATTEEGKLDVSQSKELLEMLKETHETYDVTIDLEKMNYTSQERDRLIENIKMTVDDFNVQNEMQMQAISRLNNERHELFQLAKSILKPLHEAKTRAAQAARG